MPQPESKQESATNYQPSQSSNNTRTLNLSTEQSDEVTNSLFVPSYRQSTSSSLSQVTSPRDSSPMLRKSFGSAPNISRKIETSVVLKYEPCYSSMSNSSYNPTSSNSVTPSSSLDKTSKKKGESVKNSNLAKSKSDLSSKKRSNYSSVSASTDKSSNSLKSKFGHSHSSGLEQKSSKTVVTMSNKLSGSQSANLVLPIIDKVYDKPWTKNMKTKISKEEEETLRKYTRRKYFLSHY